MNRKLVVGIGAIIALCCICSAMSLGILVLIGPSDSLNGAPAGATLPTAVPQPTIAPQPSAATTTGIITNAVMAKDVRAPNDEPVGISDTFGPDQKVFYAVVTVAHAPSGTSVSAVWKTVKVDPSDAMSLGGWLFVEPETIIGAREIQVEGSRNMSFYYKITPRMPRGTYQVEIYLNGQLDRTLHFSVTGP
jgi:hypothetical protein